MVTSACLHPVSNGPRSSFIGEVIFLHGLGGDPLTTWCHDGNKATGFWPKWLADAFPKLSVVSVGYPASPTTWIGHAIPIIPRAQNLLDLLTSSGYCTRPFILVGHSLGGVLAKQMLRSAIESRDSRFSQFSVNLRTIIFIATPHTGSSAASLTNYLSWFLAPSVLTTELNHATSAVLDLNSWFKDNYSEFSITVRSYHESKKIAGILVVDAASSDPGIPQVRSIQLDEDHISIAKPPSQNSQLYVAVCATVNEFIQTVASPNSYVRILVVIDWFNPQERESRLIKRLHQILGQLDPNALEMKRNSGSIRLRVNSTQRIKFEEGLRAGEFGDLGLLRADTVDASATTRPDRSTELYQTEVPRVRINFSQARFPSDIGRPLTLICRMRLIEAFDHLERVAAFWLGPEVHELERATVFVCAFGVRDKAGTMLRGVYAQTNLKRVGEKYTWKLMTNETFDLMEIMANLCFFRDEFDNFTPAFLSRLSEVHANKVSYLIERGLLDLDNRTVFLDLHGAQRWVGVNALE